MIGRQAELGVLLDAFEAGRRGQPAVVVVRGEAGIGKTRLLEEFCALAVRAESPRPVVVAVGQCVEVGSIGVPFTPIRRLLRALYEAVGESAFREATHSAVVLSTLGTLMPDLVDAVAAPGAEAVGHLPASGDLVGESIERIVEGLSRDRHLVLVIEDLHWADVATLDLLRVLAATLRGMHVTVVLTYRSDDVGRTHPLRRTLAELGRNPKVIGLELSRLDAEDTARLVEALAPDAPGSAVAAVIARSEGVPFFVEELADLCCDGLPDTLRPIVMARYERLSPEAAEVVGVLAVGGVQVDHDVLEAVFAGSTEALEASVREAISANVLLTDQRGYSFRHALIREAVEDDLLPGTRTRLHRRYAEALQERVDAGHGDEAAVVAEHWLAAREIESAFEATRAARTHAAQTSAFTATAMLGERLLDMWDQVRDPDQRVGRSRAELAAEVAEQWHDTVGEVSRALRVARTGLAEGPIDPVLEGRLRLIAARALGNALRYREAEAEAQRAVTTLEASSDPAALPTLAQSLSLLAYLVKGELIADGRIALIDRAVALAETSGDPDAIASCLQRKALIDFWRLDVGAAISGLVRARDTAATPELAIRCTEALTYVYNLLGRYDETVAIAADAARSAADAGLKNSFVGMLSFFWADALLALGHSEQARSVLRDSARILPDNPTFAGHLLKLQMLLSAWGDDPTRTVELRASSIGMRRDDDEDLVVWAEVDADVILTGAEIAHPDVQSALAALEPVLTTPEPPLGMCLRLLPAAARTAAEARLAGADHETADRLDALVDRACAALGDSDLARAQAALHAAERARADPHRTPADRIGQWTDAVAACATGIIPVRHLHYAHYRLVESLVQAGAHDRAAIEAAALIHEATTHGIPVAARWARELLARAGIPDPTTAHEPAAAPGLPALTARERQVLALLAEGLTNTEIGDRLYISPKTASVHVSAIFRKTGTANRAEAAALYASRSTATRR